MRSQLTTGPHRGKLKKTPKYLKVVMLGLLALAITQFSLCEPAFGQPPKTGMMIVLKSTNQTQFYGIGLIRKMNDNWAVVADAFTGADYTATQTQAVLLLTISKGATIFAAAGPELQIVQTNPTIQDKIQYLAGATTLGLTFTPAPKITTFIAIDRTDGNAPISTWKLSAGIIVWSG